jgi:hypothetical protein
MVAYNAHFHARRGQCADPRTTKQLQTLKEWINKDKNNSLSIPTLPSTLPKPAIKQAKSNKQTNKQTNKREKILMLR